MADQAEGAIMSNTLFSKQLNSDSLSVYAMQNALSEISPAFYFLMQLLRTAEDVLKMQEELESMRPLLEEAAHDTVTTMEKIKVQEM